MPFRDDRKRGKELDVRGPEAKRPFLVLNGLIFKFGTFHQLDAKCPFR